MGTFIEIISLIFKLSPTTKRWRYRLEEDFSYQTKNLEGVEFISDWFIIKDGTVTVKKDYAWDGVSPSMYLWGMWLGVWDGPKGDDGKVVSWKATVVHDALCQFIGLIKNIKKEQTVAVFKELLELNGSPKFMCKLYPFCVNYMGPQDWS